MGLEAVSSWFCPFLFSEEKACPVLRYGGQEDKSQNITKRVVSKSIKMGEKFTKRPSVFSIMLNNFYKTSEAVYHNVKHRKLKLFSFGLVSKNLENALFTKRVRSELS
jgi:hypothetical protein